MAYAPNWLIRGFFTAARLVRHPAVQLSMVAAAALDQATRVMTRREPVR